MSMAGAAPERQPDGVHGGETPGSAVIMRVDGSMPAHSRVHQVNVGVIWSVLQVWPGLPPLDRASPGAAAAPLLAVRSSQEPAPARHCRPYCFCHCGLVMGLQLASSLRKLLLSQQCCLVVAVAALHCREH